MSETFTRRLKRSALAAVTVLASALGATLPAHAELIIGLTSTNALVSFDSASPTLATNPINITGLMTNEQLLGIDLRPATGTVFGLGSMGRLYSLNTSTGAATFVSALSGATLSGTTFGVDFNPTVDRLRVTSNTGQNLRINVDTGAVTVDTPLNGAVSGLSASAYTNSFNGATTTTLYGINSTTDTVYLQNPPNNGTLTAVGALGVDTTGLIGFDISGATGNAFASLTNGDTGKSSFYSINLATGAATLIGAFGYGGNVAIAAPLRSITVLSPVPEVGTYALMLAGLAGMGAAARRRQQQQQQRQPQQA